MGNQALVPSQIQSVESYLLDLKNYIQFRASLGSTTFMKTAKVNLIESNANSFYDDFMMDASLDQIISNINQNLNISNEATGSSGQSSANNSNTSTIPSANVVSLSNQHVNQSITNATSSGSINIKMYQQQILRQKLQYLKELQQQVVVKIFPKYDMSIRLDLYTKRVREIKSIIYSRYGSSTNCLPFSELIITDRAAFLFRQFVKYNLYDRLSTRPFLTMIEKKWIAFQLLCAVNEIHSLQIVHGDMKTENVLVNSFLWVSLADFASYKPAYLSKNHPSADFNYYFDTSRRRTCYLAPERLDSPNYSNNNRLISQSPQNSNMNNLTSDQDNMYELMPPDPNDFKPSMDIFSLGCVIAELFMERPLFDFSHLLAYRERKYDPSQELINEIGDKNILDMLSSMLSLDPNERKSANQYLQEQNDKAFPSYFVTLKNYVSRFINVKMSPDDVIVKLRNDLPVLLKNFKLNLNEDEINHSSSNNQDDTTKLSDSFTPNSPLSSTITTTTNNQNTNDAFLILLSLLLSTIRKLKFTENKLIAIDLMTNFSKFLDDSIILDRILPYYLSLIDQKQQQSTPSQSTSSPIVKSHVIYALNDCLANILNIDVQNLNIFPELIFDYLDILSKDESFLVRSTVAKTISNFALTSLRYLDTVFLTKRSFLNNNNNKTDDTNKNDSSDNLNKTNNNSNNTLNVIDNNNTTNTATTTTNDNNNHITAQTTDFDKDKEKFATYDKEYEYYQFRITEIVMHLITDINQTSNGSSASNAVKETLIRSDISKLCSFFSRQKTSEFLLPHMITILNEKTDWSVRAAFFDALCPVLTCIGWESVEIVKSLLEQGLRDSEEFVIHRTLITLSKMVEIGLLDRQQICYFLSTHIAPFLCHPSLWIRHGAVNFITTVCKQNNNNKALNGTGLNTADILCSVAPVLTKFLQRSDLISYDKEEILFNCLKQPIKRAVYDRISQDGASDQLFIYLNQRSEIRCLTNQNYLPGYVDCTDQNVQQLFEKLCKLGFIEEDEDKLLHLKDFIEKTRISRLSSSLHNSDAIMNMNNSTTSVLNASSNLFIPRENFSLKDGYITIMKEKFQKCNCEYLNTRKDTNNLYYNNNENSKRSDSSNISKTNSNLITNNTSIKDDTISNNSGSTTSTTVQNDSSNYNAEWKLMFGGGSSSTNKTPAINESGVGDSSSPPNSIVKQQKSTKNSPSSNENLISPNSNRQRVSQIGSGGGTNVFNNLNRSSTKQHSDCTIEVEKYLDLSKFIYDEHKLKQNRVNKFKETISSSTSSNTICLSSSIGKWKPKGFILAHSNEHTKEINKLCRNPDSNYFASCSTSESVVKIWSTDNLLDGKSGFVKPIFTFDRQNAATRDTSISNMDHMLNRPCCITFYNTNSLAILCEDFKFYMIDFNSNRSQYRLYSNEKLFRSTTCKNCTLSDPQIIQNSFDKITHYYLFNNKSMWNKNGKYYNNSKMCLCTSNYPIDMILIDDTCSSWPVASTDFYEYYRGSNVKGLFCYSTSTGDMGCIDMRTRSKAFDVKRDLRRGYITTMITDPWYTWIACGTSNGQIEIFDFRFMVPIQSFEHRSRTSVVKLCNHPMSNNRIIASYQGNNEICVWNMNTSAVQSAKQQKTTSVSNNSNNKYTRTSCEPEFVFWGVQSVPPLSQNKISSYYISGLIGCSAGEENGSNGLICASTDMKMRYIDLNEPARDSYVISSAFNFQQNSKVSSDLSSQQQQQVVAATTASASTATSPSSNSSSQASSLRGNEFANSLMSQSVNYEMRVIEGNKVLLEFDQQNQNSSSSISSSSSTTTYSYNSPALAHQSYFTHHQDAITDLIVCYNPISNKNQPLVVTSARDGTLKIWR